MPQIMSKPNLHTIPDKELKLSFVHSPPKKEKKKRKKRISGFCMNDMPPKVISLNFKPPQLFP